MLGAALSVACALPFGELRGLRTGREGGRRVLALEALQRVREDWTPVPVPEPMTLHIPIRYSLSKS